MSKPCECQFTADQKHATATALANDLAEAYVASNIADMMIIGSREKAKAIRALSEANTDQGNRAVQEYRSTQRAIYSALWDLLDGYGGYKLVKQEQA
ncbi:MAG: hypothetical protein ACKO0Z_16655 [Betaproteobacteria bacterium]